jgi:hypothetical protein
MMNGKDIIADFLGRTIFLVLFCLIVSSFSDNMTSRQLKFSNHYELKCKLYSHAEKAAVSTAFQLPSFRKNRVILQDKMNLNLFNCSVKLSVDNRIISQKIISIHKDQLRIKPMIIYRLYYPLYDSDSEELPFLS